MNMPLIQITVLLWQPSCCYRLVNAQFHFIIWNIHAETSLSQLAGSWNVAYISGKDVLSTSSKTIFKSSILRELLLSELSKYLIKFSSYSFVSKFFPFQDTGIFLQSQWCLAEKCKLNVGVHCTLQHLAFFFFSDALSFQINNLTSADENGPRGDWFLKKYQSFILLFSFLAFSNFFSVYYSSCKIAIFSYHFFRMPLISWDDFLGFFIIPSWHLNNLALNTSLHCLFLLLLIHIQCCQYFFGTCYTDPQKYEALTLAFGHCCKCLTLF